MTDNMIIYKPIAAKGLIIYIYHIPTKKDLLELVPTIYEEIFILI